MSCHQLRAHRFVALTVAALVAVAAGRYTSALFFGGAAPWSKVLTTAAILTVVAANVTGARFVDRARNMVLVVLLSVLAVVAAAALARLDLRLFDPVTDSPATAILDGVALTFLAALLATSSSYRHAVAGPRGTWRRGISAVTVLLLANLVDLALLAAHDVVG